MPVLAGAEADAVALGERGLWLHLVCSPSGMLGFRELPSPWILSSPGPQPPAAFHLGPEDPSQVLVLAKQTRHALRHRPSLLDSLFSQDTRKPPTSAMGTRPTHRRRWVWRHCLPRPGRKPTRTWTWACTCTHPPARALPVCADTTGPRNSQRSSASLLCRSSNLSLGLRRI